MYALNYKTLQDSLRRLRSLWAITALILITVFLTGCQVNSLKMTFSKPAIAAKPVTMVFIGDIMLDRYVRRYMNKNGLDYPFAKMDLNYLQTPDLLIANLEGPIAKNKAKTGKTIAFRFLPDVVPLLKKYSFDVLSLANNHAMDMGTNGYQDSRDLLTEAGIKFFGDPRKVTEDSISKVEINGQKLAFLGLEEVVYKINDQKAVETIRKLTAEGYKVIPFPHWGIEYQHKPNKRQIELAHKFIDAGAYMVIGGHPHVVQSYENYKGRPIFYSLGNAIFDQYFSADTQEGLSIKITINPADAAPENTPKTQAGSKEQDTTGTSQLKIELHPISILRSQMELMGPDQRSKFLERFITYGQYSEEEKAQLIKGELIF